MTGPKLNEKSFVVGERAGTKATAKYVRSSASKARVVLDLIRGLDVRSADEVLQFTDRHIARDVRKVLASAVANAVNNDDQDADELFVVACFADEGPTLRRFRPRARGRATRINKRTCHITVVVARMSDERIEILQARQERAGGAAGRGRPQSSSASRRSRVERSRKKAAEQTGEDTTAGDAAEAAEADEATAAAADERDAVDTTASVAADAEEAAAEGTAIEDTAAEATADTDADTATESEEADVANATADADEPAEGSASDEADASRGGSEADDEGATK